MEAYHWLHEENGSIFYHSVVLELESSPWKKTCHAKCTSGPPSATPATQSERRCHQAPGLPRKVTVHVATRHACHAKRRSTPATRPQDPSAPPEPVQCHKCHACQAKCASMSPSARPARQSDGPCRQAPRLPRKAKVNVAKCHTCHANSFDVHGVNWDPSAPPEPVQSYNCHAACHAKCTKCHICHAK